MVDMLFVPKNQVNWLTASYCIPVNQFLFCDQVHSTTTQDLSQENRML